MARETSSVVGSGTIQGVAGILPLDARGVEPEGRGEWRGTNVVVVNPEDLNSAAAFGILNNAAVGTTAVELVSFGINPLPRSGKVLIKNLTAETVFIGPTDGVTSSTGYPLGQNEELCLTVLKNTSIWALTAANTADVRVIVL